MRALVKFLVAMLFLLVVSVVVVGPGRLVAGAEYPLGIGPWGSTGRYCQHMYSLTHLVEVWHHSDRSATAHERSTYRALETSLTSSGPEVPKADFAEFFQARGNVVKTMSAQSVLLNTWWDQHCTQMWMEAPASLNSAWSGIIGHERFTHFPKNVVVVRNFFRVTA
ncbi:MAG: hypothetical protein WCF25_04910 [Acidimicrobiales bacterium]